MTPTSTPKKTKKTKITTTTNTGETSTSPKKIFVLDTNVLLHDPQAVHKFEDNDLYIPLEVISELDNFKTELTDRGVGAREVHRVLVKLFENNEGFTATLPSSGTINLIALKESEIPFGVHNLFTDICKVDHKILMICAALRARNLDRPVILVTKDLNMMLKARAIGIQTEDYRNNKVDLSEVQNNDLKRIEVSPHDLQRFSSTGELEVTDESLYLNEYVLLSGGEKSTILAAVGKDRKYRKLHYPDGIKLVGSGRTIKGLNAGQLCLLDALYNPEISLVTCYGRAGTGKTLLSVASGLDLVNNGNFSGLTISRPIVAMGQTVGFLPGTLEEKLRPWLQPVYDALDLLLRPIKNTQGPGRKKNKFLPDTPQEGPPPYDELMKKGILEVEALCYIRGRSIPDRFFILDEAQQLTPLEAKTVITRMSRGSKLVLTGDPFQIDNPYVDSRSNGLVYAREKMKGLPFVAHIPLSKGERSDLAEAGAMLL